MILKKRNRVKKVNRNSTSSWCWRIETLGSGSFDDTKKLEELLKGGWKADVEEEAPQQKYQLFEKAETMDGASREVSTCSDVFSRYIGDLKMEHEDFDVKSKNYEVFRVQDYNWKEDGFELVRRFMPGNFTHSFTFMCLNTSKELLLF